jgi:putative ABC transport system ATP-binding protein
MAVELNNIRFHYASNPGKTVLNIPSWSVQNNDRILVTGPSGCGKSTLLSILCGLEHPNEGSVTLFGERIDKMNARQRDRFRANHIGYIFQKLNLIPYLNAIDNIMLATRFCESNKVTSYQEVMAMLDSLNLSAQDWNKPIRLLSVGQQQRVAIARALINKPKLLIADEPTSSLDLSNRDAFMTLLMSMIEMTDMTLLFVSHDVSLSGYFNHTQQLKQINHIEGGNNAF